MALGQRSGERVCVLWSTNLTTYDVSASLGEILCQIHAREINRFVGNGPEVRVRCSGWRRQLCVKIQNKTKNGIPYRVVARKLALVAVGMRDTSTNL